MICELQVHGPEVGPRTLEFEAASTMIRHLGLLINSPRRSHVRRDLSAGQTGLLTVMLAGVVGLYLLTTAYSASRRFGTADGSVRGAGLHAIDRAKPAELRRMETFAAGRRGYLVWESRRPTGTDELKYRIWKRNLDGSGLAMISGGATESGYAHLGPRISPDGRHVIFAGKSWDSSGTPPNAPAYYGNAYAAPPFDAWIVTIDPGTLEASRPRELVSLRGQVGSGGVDRFFEWKDDRTVYVRLPQQRGIFEVNVFADRVGRKVVNNVEGEWLLAANGRLLFRAASGGACVRPVGPGPSLRLPGCQTTVSASGDLAVWMRAPGRAAAISLNATSTPESGRDLGLPEVIARTNSPYGFCYFPAISRGATVLACGGSRLPPGTTSDQRGLQMSHRGADFEIFLINFDPCRAAVKGDAVRYSFNEHAMYPELLDEGQPDWVFRRGHALDRFPDVWIEGERVEPPQPQQPATRLDRARELETINPRAALALYRELAADCDAAVKRLAELQRDGAFQEELRAWAIFEAMRSARGHDAIKAHYAELARSHESTRAMLEARRLARERNITVPRYTPESQRTVAVVDVVATEVSTPLTVDAAYPYTQALLTAEFRVTKIVSGELADESVVVVLMSMDDGRDRPAASLKPGAKCRIRLGAWSAQTHLQSHKMSDDIMPLDATLYYAHEIEIQR
jgi:hypothetical protein